MSIIKKLLGESSSGPYDGVVYPAVIVRPTEMSTHAFSQSSTGEKCIELAFPGKPATQILGITIEAASKLAQDLQAAIAGSSQPPASSASLAPAGTPPGPST
jgi:hypothetical protein